MKKKKIKRTGHEPIVNRVHDFITDMYPPKWMHVEELCRIFFDIPDNEAVSKADDSRMRKIINEIKLSHTFHKIIITSAKGIKVAESEQEAKHYRSIEIARLEAAKETVEMIDHRLKHHDFERLPLSSTGRPLPRYEAIVTVSESGQAAFQI